MTIKTVSILAVAAVVCGIAATAAIAQNGTMNDGHMGRFDAQDTNHDGAIDRSEAAAAAMSRFDALDADHDGRLTRDEIRGVFKARWQARRDGAQTHRFGKLDANGDGKLTWDEMSARAKARFDALDTNHDGFIDDSEMTQARGHWRHHDDGAAPTQ